MHDLDDDGLVNLVKGVVVTAERDAKHGDTDASDFLTWLRGEQEKLDAAYQRIDATLARMNGTAPKPAAPKPAPEQLSQDEINDRARRLTDLGISPQWAAIQADPVKMAEADKQQRRRDLATRLGVLPQFLPEGAEDEI